MGRKRTAKADFSVIHFSSFADAAFVRKRGTFIAVSQRMSWKRTFAGIKSTRAETVISPQLHRTTQTRDEADIATQSINNCNEG